jgi:hypothetical protein
MYLTEGTVDAPRRHGPARRKAEDQQETRHRAVRAAFVGVLDAKYRVLEADMWLNQEKAR